MLITMLDKSGRPKAEISPDDNSTQTKEIQGDNVLALSFTHHDHITLDVDDRVDYLGERYWLCEKYRPRQKSTREWAYDIKLYGVESLLRNILVIKMVDGEDEPVFTLTAPPREHVAMIVRCLNEGMGDITDWKAGRVDGTGNIVIDYFGKYCDEALKEIAEKTGTEWWVDGQTVNICRCEHGEPVTLGHDKGLLGIEPDRADNIKFYTRLYPVGSSRNIDPEKYGHSRLQLPDGRKYVEVNADKYGRVDHYEESAFEEIYPRRVGVVSSVRSEEKTGEDGNPFTVYYFKDDGMTFDPNEYELPGRVKRVSFQEGSELGGLGTEEDGTYFFEVNFDSMTREFEIITIWPYKDSAQQLPGGNMVPKPGDEYILWNLRMPDEYYGLAEKEFLEAVEKYNEEHGLDITVFKSPTDHVWIEDNEVELSIGRRVRLESGEYFPEDGFRESRITKITRKVNLPSSMEIEIGDTLGRSARQKFTDDINDARSYARSMSESVAMPDIIRMGDKTTPTDNNLFSARRTLDEALSRKRPDQAHGLKSFLDGVEVGDFATGIKGARVTTAGDGEVESLKVRKGASVGTDLAVGRKVTVGNYVPGVSGGVFYVDENGEAHIETGQMTVNGKLRVKEIEVQQQTWVGGAQILSPAGMVCEKVEPRVDGQGAVWQTFRCPVDTSRFKPSTDYTLSLDATFQTEDEESAVTQGKMVFRASVSDATQQVFLCPWAAPDIKEYTPGEETPLRFLLRTPATLPAQKMFLQFIIRDWDDRTEPVGLSFLRIKLEEGTVATPWVPADKDLESIIDQQAGQIALSVKVDGEERAGLTLDREEGVTLQADKVRIKNGDLLAALFTNGILNADLVEVNRLATKADGKTRVTIGEFNDAFIRFYHDDGVTLALKLGLDYVSLEEGATVTPSLSPAADKAGDGDTARAAVQDATVIPIFRKGKPAVAQVFDEEGVLTWVLFLDGPVTPDTQPYSWRTYSLVRETAANQAAIRRRDTLKAEEYWQFKVRDGVSGDYTQYRNKLFTRKMSDTDFTAAAYYYAPDGRYFFPAPELQPATVTNPQEVWTRRYHDVKSGVLSSTGSITLEN